MFETMQKRKYKSLDRTITYDKTSTAALKFVEKVEETDLLQFTNYNLPQGLIVPPILLSSEVKLTQGAFAIVSIVTLRKCTLVMKKLNERRAQCEVDVRKFVRETKLISWFGCECMEENHQIIKILGWYQNPLTKCFYFLMPMMSNGDLHHFISSRQSDCVEFKQKVVWALQISKALCFIHSRGYIHCDMKSLNILLDEHLNAFVSDFCDTKHLTFFDINEEDVSVQPHGTIFWMSPEMIQLQNSDQKNLTAITDRSDIYSFAIILYEIFAWTKPYAELNSLQVLEIMKEDKHYRMKIPSCVPHCLQEVIESCWQTDPTLRPSSEKLLESLSGIMNEYN